MARPSGRERGSLLRRKLDVAVVDRSGHDEVLAIPCLGRRAECDREHEQKCRNCRDSCEPMTDRSHVVLPRLSQPLAREYPACESTETGSRRDPGIPVSSVSKTD